MSPITDEQAGQIANDLKEGLDGFFAADGEGKAKIVKKYLDEQIGAEPHASIKSVPGMPLLSGQMLESISDIMLDAVANVIAKKLGGAG